jgi:hypothetical protein
MKLYFLSSTPCALLINGAYFGITDLFERTADIDLRDNLYAEFLPENAQPIRFFITERLRETPPNGCEVYLLEDGIAIYARDFQPTDLTLRVIWQEKMEDCLITLFSQGRLYLSVQTEQNFFNAYLPPSFASARLEMHSGLIFLSAPDALAVFTKEGKRLLQEKLLSCSVEEGVLSARLPLCDRLGRFADCRWELSPTECRQTAFVIRQAKPADETDSEEKIDGGLLAYAFFESVLIGANFEDMLCDELLADKDKICAFLGNFESVILTENPLRCGLVRKKAEGLFSVDYFQISAKEGKIIEITA